MERMLLSAILVITGYGVAAGQQGADSAQQPPKASVATSLDTTPQNQPSSTPNAECDPQCDLLRACGPPGRFWMEADYLLWQIKGDSLPPLLATSPAGTPRNQAGVLGAPGTAILFGGSNVGQDWQSGGRLRLGYWLDPQQTLGVQAEFFMLGNAVGQFNAASDGSQILTRPFTNALTGAPDAELVAFPGVLSGMASIRDSTSLLGAGALVRYNLCCGDCYRVDGLIGYRFLRMIDNLSISETLTTTSSSNPSVPLGTQFAIVDHFNTTNDFNGVDLGLAGEFRRGAWSLGWTAKVALGENLGVVNTFGTTTVTVPGAAPVNSPGGLLALSSNSGTFNVNHFAVVPEVGLKLGYQITPALRATVGYNFIYWTNVVRPGQQIDTFVNPNLLPPPVTPLVGPNRPAPELATTNLWLQGVSFGFEFRY